MIISTSLLLADYPRMAYWILFWKRNAPAISTLANLACRALSLGWSFHKLSYLNAYLFYLVRYVQCYGCISSISEYCLYWSWSAGTSVDSTLLRITITVFRERFFVNNLASKTWKQGVRGRVACNGGIHLPLPHSFWPSHFGLRRGVPTRASSLPWVPWPSAQKPRVRWSGIG